MTDSIYPITTGLSIDLMDKFDQYRAAGVQLITSYQFAADLTIALRQQFNKDIDATIDLIAKNPRPAPVVVASSPLALPGITTPSTPVFIEQPLETVVTPPASGFGFNV